MQDEEAIDPRQIPDIIEWLLELYSGKTEESRKAILAHAIQIWPTIEYRLIMAGDVSVREAFLIMEEAVVDEVRKQQLDLAARSKFAKPKQRIKETRAILDATLNPVVESPELRIARSAEKMRLANDLIEWEG